MLSIKFISAGHLQLLFINRNKNSHNAVHTAYTLAFLVSAVMVSANMVTADTLHHLLHPTPSLLFSLRV